MTAEKHQCLEALKPVRVQQYPYITAQAGKFVAGERYERAGSVEFIQFKTNETILQLITTCPAWNYENDLEKPERSSVSTKNNEPFYHLKQFRIIDMR